MPSNSVRRFGLTAHSTRVFVYLLRRLRSLFVTYDNVGNNAMLTVLSYLAQTLRETHIQIQIHRRNTNSESEFVCVCLSVCLSKIIQIVVNGFR